MNNKKPIRTHGRSFVGVVISTKMAKTATVEWETKRYIPKFERYEKKRTRVKAHNQTDAKKGDIVRITQTRPLSKTKHFIIIEHIGKEKLFEEKQALLDQGKHKTPKVEQKVASTTAKEGEQA